MTGSWKGRLIQWRAEVQCIKRSDRLKQWIGSNRIARGQNKQGNVMDAGQMGQMLLITALMKVIEMFHLILNSK